MKEYSKRVFVAVVIIIATISVPYLIYLLFPHFIPFFLAYFTALALEPLASWIRKNFRITKNISVIITFTLFLGGSFLLFYLITTKIYGQLWELLSFFQANGPKIAQWFLALSKQIQSTIGLLPHDTAVQINQMLLGAINNLTNLNLMSRIGTYTLGLSTAIPNLFFLTLIYLISVYLLIHQLDNIKRRFFSFFKDSSQRKVIYVLGDLKRATFGFFKAQIILSALTFLLSFFGLLILRVEYAALIALLIVIVDILPILGTGSVLLPWALICLLQGNIFMAAGLVILFIVIIIIRKSIEPKVLGERIGLSALATLVSIWVGFKVLGIAGIFLFPLALIFYKALVKVGVINTDFRI